MTTTLPSSDHIQIAREFLDESDREFAVGKVLKGSEMLWGAAAHALIAVALQNGWPHNSHGAMKNVARRLPDIPKEPHWLSEFATAERFHINFYHGNMTSQAITRNRPKVRRFIVRLLDLTD